MAKQITTGFVQRDDKLQWTSIQLGAKGESTLAERGTSQPPTLDADDDGKKKQVLLGDLLTQDASRLTGELHYAIPAEKTLLRVLDLPTTEEDEIDGMVELQIDKVSPYPVDLMYISWERLKETENGVRVVVAAAQKKALDAIGSVADSQGLVLHRIDVDLLCWIDLLTNAGEIPEHGRHVMILADRKATHLVIFDHQVPVLLNSFSDITADGSHQQNEQQDADDKDENSTQTSSGIFLQEIAEELDLTMTSLEGEWGVEEYITCSVWHWTPAPSGTQHLEDTLGCQIHLHNFSSLPDLSEGVTNRAIRSAPEGLVDIAPNDWKQAEERRRTRKQLFLGSAVVMGLWLIGLIGFFIWVGVQDSQLATLRSDLEATEEPAQAVKELQRRVHELSQYTNRTYSALECFREVIETMPAGVELSELTYDKSMGVRLRGESRVPNNLNLMIKGLSESTLFTEVEDVSIDGSKMKATVFIPRGEDS